MGVACEVSEGLNQLLRWGLVGEDSVGKGGGSERVGEGEFGAGVGYRVLGCRSRACPACGLLGRRSRACPAGMMLG